MFIGDCSTNYHYQLPAHHFGAYEKVLDELNHRLSLTPDQDARVRAIVMASQSAVDTAWSAVREHLEQATARTIAQIEAELDEDQRELLRAWVVERHGELPAVDSTSH